MFSSQNERDVFVYTLYCPHDRVGKASQRVFDNFPVIRNTHEPKHSRLCWFTRRLCTLCWSMKESMMCSELMMMVAQHFLSLDCASSQPNGQLTTGKWFPIFSSTLLVWRLALQIQGCRLRRCNVLIHTNLGFSTYFENKSYIQKKLYKRKCCKRNWWNFFYQSINCLILSQTQKYTLTEKILYLKKDILLKVSFLLLSRTSLKNFLRK